MYLVRHLDQSTAWDNEQWLVKFDNGYGASIVRGPFSYGGTEGLFEVAVVWFFEDGGWVIDYETSITDDVIGYLSMKNLRSLLRDIEALPPKK